MALRIAETAFPKISAKPPLADSSAIDLSFSFLSFPKKDQFDQTTMVSASCSALSPYMILFRILGFLL
jgi:hypothetical protein